jgi:hypothetical protein
MATFPILFPLKQDGGGTVLPDFANQLLTFFNDDEAAVNLYILQLLSFLEDEVKAQVFLANALTNSSVEIASIRLLGTVSVLQSSPYFSEFDDLSQSPFMVLNNQTSTFGAQTPV